MSKNSRKWEKSLEIILEPKEGVESLKMEILGANDSSRGNVGVSIF